MLNCLHTWCEINKMTVNHNKSKVIHFRTPSVDRTSDVFTCGDKALEIVDCYNYLGLLLTEHLNYQRMGRAVASSASRALGLLISKYKTLGGMNYHTFTKLYDTMVWSTMEYGAAIWGTYTLPAINAIQNRAMRFFYGREEVCPKWSCGRRHGLDSTSSKTVGSCSQVLTRGRAPLTRTEETQQKAPTDTLR